MSLLTPQPVLRSSILALVAAAVTVIAGFGLASPPAQAAGNLVIYNNSMRSAAGAAKIRKYGKKANCSHKGSTKSLRVKVGKSTRECFYNVPVVGRDLQASITARMFKQTPKGLQKRTWLAVNVRQGTDGSRYQFAVLPRQQRFSLRKVYPNGKVKHLAHGKDKKIRTVAKANRITLRAYNGVGKLPSGTARLVGIVNGKRLALFDDQHGNELTGRDTTISIGSNKGAKGAFGSFIGARVAMPDPF